MYGQVLPGDIDRRIQKLEKTVAFLLKERQEKLDEERAKKAQSAKVQTVETEEKPKKTRKSRKKTAKPSESETGKIDGASTEPLTQ